MDKSISWTYQTIYGDPTKKEKKSEADVNQSRDKVSHDNENKTYQRVDRVTVLGLVCEKMSQRVILGRQEEEDGRERQEVSNITQDHAVEEEDMEDDEGVEDEREIFLKRGKN